MYIHKMPFVIGSFMAVVTGLISYICGADSKTIYIRMAVIMVVFFILMSFVKNTIIAIKEEVDKKKEEELKKMELEEELQRAENEQNEAQNENNQEHIVNLIADDSDEEFSPLTVNRIITSKAKE